MALSQTSDQLGIASALSPALFALGDPDRFVEVLNSNPAGVVMVEASPSLPVVYCNDAFRRWVPLARRQIVGRPLPDLFAWGDRAAVRSAYRQVVRTGQPLHLRSAPYHDPSSGPSERRAYWNVSHYPLWGAAGQVTHVLSFTVDVTERASVRARMREAQHRVLAGLGGIARQLSEHTEVEAFFGQVSATLAGLVPAARAAFWLFEPTTATISPQPAAFGFTAADLERLQGIPWRPDADGPGDAYRFAVETLGVADEITIPWRAGDRRLGLVAVYDSTRPAGFSEEDIWVLQAAATTAALVWEHRQADEGIAALREREAASLRHKIEQSIELEQLKTDFLKLASHQLRGPLGIVRGYISMMEDGTLAPVGEEVGSVLPMLRAKLDEMNQLINEMLETARLEDSALELDVSRLDLRDVVHEAVRSLEPLAGERHRLLIETAGGPVLVDADRSRVSMIVTNLVHNALKYSPAGGVVHVTCQADGDAAEVAVSDQGVGIAPEDVGRLFTRFGRIVTPETAGIAGTGLGLYLARDLAHRHGGDVDVVSRAGEGSTFKLTLPLAR